jgi:hypothetical protein
MINFENLDFGSIDHKQFEGICFELIWRNDFKNVEWRGSTDDQGRDIEAIYEIENPITGNIYEKWHFECKKYKKAVPKTDLIDKIAWADANKPDALVFLLSSHLSNQTKDWLSKISKQKPYRIYVIEGTELKKLIFKLPDLIGRYFNIGGLGFLKSLMNNWLLYNSEPSTGTLKNLLKSIEFEHASDSELLYLLSASLIAKNRVFESDEGVHDLNFDMIMKEFSKRVGNRSKKIITNEEQVSITGITEDHFYYRKKEYYFCISDFMILNGDNFHSGLHCVMGDGEWWSGYKNVEFADTGFEFFLFENSNFETRMRKIKSEAMNYLRELETKKISFTK